MDNSGAIKEIISQIRLSYGEAKNLEDFKLLLKKSGIDENQVFDFLSMRPGEDVFGDINFSELENKLL